MTFLWSAEPYLLFNGLGQYQGSIEIKEKPFLGWNHHDCGLSSPLYPVGFYRYDWRVSVIGQGQHFPKVCLGNPVPRIITPWAAVEKAYVAKVAGKMLLLNNLNLPHA